MLLAMNVALHLNGGDIPRAEKCEPLSEADTERVRQIVRDHAVSAVDIRPE